MERHMTLGEGGQSPSRLLESKTYEVAGKLTGFQTPAAYAFYSHLLRPFVSPCYGKDTRRKGQYWSHSHTASEYYREDGSSPARDFSLGHSELGLCATISIANQYPHAL